MYRINAVRLTKFFVFSIYLHMYYRMKKKVLDIAGFLDITFLLDIYFCYFFIWTNKKNVKKEEKNFFNLDWTTGGSLHMLVRLSAVACMLNVYLALLLGERVLGDLSRTENFLF